MAALAPKSIAIYFHCLRALIAPFATALAPPAFSTEAADKSDAAQQCRAAYAQQLSELAQWCDASGLSHQAELTRAWLPKRDPAMIYIFALPESSQPPAALIESDSAKEWWDRFMALRSAQADRLFKLAESASKDKQPVLAMELAREAVRENPDHARARAVLGFERSADRWVTPEAARRLRAGQVWSDKFGWLPEDHLARYEQGMRYDRGRWMDAAEDARMHSSIRGGWRVETDHFAVTTNHSLEEGVRLAKQLESLHDIWRQVFLEYYASSADVQRWFASGTTQSPAAVRKLHQVVYFRDKQGYVEALTAVQPQVAISLGTYLDDAKTAYFYAGDKQYDGTLYHEATHQLFREARPGAIDPGRRSNFWAVEAVACYMESLAEHRLLPEEAYGMYYTVGGANEARVPAARKRVVDDKFYIPLRDLVPLGMIELQHDQRLRQIYSQSAGLAWFLMHAQDAHYRSALMQYLVAIYMGRADVGTLEKVTGTSYERLDQQYREFMK